MPHIELSKVGYAYAGTDGPVTALSEVSFDVAASEFLCIVGRSGCGKTTLLNIVAGFLRPTAGEIRIGGEVVTGRGGDRGVVFQDFAQLFPWRTAQRNVEFGLQMRGVAAAERAETARRFLKLVDLERFAAAYPHELSGGMQQRVAIARALVHDPSILLLDEPFSALDMMTRNQLNIELLRIWSERRKTSLLITHSIPEAVFLSDRVVVLGPRPANVLEIVPVTLPRPRSPEMRVSSDFIKIVDHIGRRIGLEYV
jgi:NitT/TauT family transport system ATP-binding protein